MTTVTTFAVPEPPPRPDLAVRGLSVRQPWAHCITTGSKTIENRKWATDYRGRLLIHASRTVDEAAVRHPLVPQALAGCRRLPMGAVVAVADLIDCHRCGTACTPWAQPEMHHWVLDRIRPLAHPVPCRGRLQLWHPSRTVLDAIRDQDPDLIAPTPAGRNV